MAKPLPLEHTLVRAFSSLVEYRDPETGYHLDRMAEVARSLAEVLAPHRDRTDLSEQEWIDVIYHAAPLHDVGKVGIPDRILMKPDRLTPSERRVMETHATIGASFLRQIQEWMGDETPLFLRIAEHVCESHHEAWNGKGYPNGLAGDEIPLVARVTAVADFYDALRNPRVYRPYGLSHEEVESMIVAGRGTHFDPAVVDAFLERKDEIQRFYVRKTQDAEKLREVRDRVTSSIRREMEELGLVADSTGEPTRVLMVEDNIMTQNNVRELLLRMEMHCDIATNVDEARRYLEDGHYQIVLLDVMLPGESGETLLEELQSFAPDTVVIVVSGQNDMTTALRIMRTGAYDYLQKPCEGVQLRVAIEGALSRRRAELENRAYRTRLESMVSYQTAIVEEFRSRQERELVEKGR